MSIKCFSLFSLFCLFGAVAQNDALDIIVDDDGVLLPVIAPIEASLPTSTLSDSESIEQPDQSAYASLNDENYDAALSNAAPSEAIVELVNDDANVDDGVLYPSGAAPILNNSVLDAMPNGQSPSIISLISRNVGYIDWQGTSNRLRSPDEVARLYSQVDYQPLWTADGYITSLANSLISEVNAAWQHALRPQVYHSLILSSFISDQQIPEPSKFDVLLTDAFITLKKHLTNGIIDPKTQFPEWNEAPEFIDFYQVYSQASQAGNVQGVFSIDNPDYAYLKQAYIDLSSTQEADEPTVKIDANRLELGQRHPAIMALRERLGLPTYTEVYDQSVKQAVIDYQRANNLQADGIAGRNTIAHLNGETTSRANRLIKLALNMERMRWHAQMPTERYVWVNIPAYKMAVRQGREFIFESNVIVGRPKRPTPIFRDTLEHVVLSPYWNVPKTIFAEDKLPKLLRNPHALGQSIQVISKATGSVVDPASVDWQTSSAEYRLRQLPGNRNALGRMKFLFPNKHAIYLHDTPSRHLFKKTRRAFSSGCVRVERAEDLAVFLLDDNGYTRDSIKRDSRRSSEKWVNLVEHKRYPVMLDYYTAWVDQFGEVRYSSDIYRYDKKLSQQYSQTLKAL